MEGVGVMATDKPHDEEFQRAFEAAKARLNPQHGPTVLELRAGDLFYHPAVGHMMFVCRGQHPIWASLQAVVWCDSTGNLSIDTLSPQQVITGQLTNRDESPQERGKRFRQWYLERKPK